MASLFVTFSFLVIVIVRYLRNKSTVGLILSWMILAPYIQVGGMKYSASYLVAVVLFTVTIIRNPRIKRLPEGLSQYLAMLFTINLLFVVSWVLFSRKDPRTMLSMLFGALKNIILLFVCWNMNTAYFKGSALQTQISRMLRWLLVLNMCAVILQMLLPESMGRFFSQFINDAHLANLETVLRYGSYSRCSGLFSLATYLGVFALLALTYILVIDMNMNRKEKFVYSISAIFCGISSASKTFLFGTLFMLCTIAIGNLIRKRLKTVYIWATLSALLGVLAIYLFRGQIYNIVFDLFGGNAARPFLFINNLSQIFITRFDAKTGSMFTTGLVDVVKNNLLLGVGTSSIMGEQVMDNAILVILHNGGLVCLCIVLSYYLRAFLRPRFDIKRAIVLVILLISGIGFDTWTQPLSTWLILVVVFENRNAYNLHFER